MSYSCEHVMVTAAVARAPKSTTKMNETEAGGSRLLVAALSTAWELHLGLRDPGQGFVRDFTASVTFCWSIGPQASPSISNSEPAYCGC